jgi:mRNA interferase MazF
VTTGVRPQAVDVDERHRIVEEAGPDIRAVGIEVFFGTEEGLAEIGVVRVALPRDGKVFCTWGTTISAESLIERIGVLSAAKQRQLNVALSLAAGADLFGQA